MHVDLPDARTGGVVVRREQVRAVAVGIDGSADGLAVAGDDRASVDSGEGQSDPRVDTQVEPVGVDGAQDPVERRQ